MNPNQIDQLTQELRAIVEHGDGAVHEMRLDHERSQYLLNLILSYDEWSSMYNNIFSQYSVAVIQNDKIKSDIKDLVAQQNLDKDEIELLKNQLNVFQQPIKTIPWFKKSKWILVKDVDVGQDVV